MAFTPTPFTPFVWSDYPSTLTPINAADLNGAETGIVGYAQSLAQQVITYLQVNSIPTRTLESFGAVGDGISDDTAAFQLAAQAGPCRIVGLHKSYKLTGPVNLYTDASHNAQGQAWDMRGVTVTTTTTTDAIFKDQVSDGATFRKSFTVLGGTWVGGGLTGLNSNALVCCYVMNQWTDVRIIGGDYSNFTYCAGNFGLCSRVTITDTTVHDITIAGGGNAWNFLDGQISGSPSFGLGNIEGSFSFVGNRAYPGTLSIATAAVAVIATHGNWANADALIADNRLWTNGVSNIFLEINSYNSGAGDALNRRIAISSNLLYNSSTGTQGSCLYAADDGASPFNDPLKMASLSVTGNIMMSESNATVGNGGAILQGGFSRAQVKDNLLVANGTNGQCILFKPDPTTTMSDVVFDNNDFYQVNANATTCPITLLRLTNFQITGGRLKSLATGQHGTGAGGNNGIFVDSTCSQGFIGGSIVIDGANQAAIWLETMNDMTVDGFRIRNWNAGNLTSGSNSSAAIVMNNAPIGSLNLIQNGTFVDDRNSKQGQYYLLCANSPTTKPKLRNLVGQGAVASSFNGGSVGFYGEMIALSFDNLTGLDVSNATAGASPATVGPFAYDAEFFLSAVNGLSQLKYNRVVTGTSLTLTTATAGPFRLRRGDTLTLTWATTAPTYSIIPMP